MGMPDPDARALATQPTTDPFGRLNAMADQEIGAVRIPSGHSSPRGELILMRTVLFKTDEPTNREAEVEFYIVSLSLLKPTGEASIVEETHGWWSNITRKPIFDQEHTVPPETFKSFSHAVDRYCALRLARAREGFVHSFSWEGFVGNPMNYRKIDLCPLPNCPFFEE
jgi:hypothetical protein